MGQQNHAQNIRSTKKDLSATDVLTKTTLPFYSTHAEQVVGQLWQHRPQRTWMSRQRYSFPGMLYLRAIHS